MNKTLVRILIGLLALILLVVGFVALVATTPWGQRFVTNQVNNYLAKKIQSPFRIGRITYHIPDWIELQDVYFQTPKGDTLLSGGSMRIDLDMWGLLNNRIELNQIALERIRLNVYRTLPDTTFNFQYIIDAFDTGPTDSTTVRDTAAAPLAINVSDILLKDVRIRYRDDVVGADVNAYVDSLMASFNETDVSRSRYHLASVAVDGLNAYTRLYEGLPTPDTPDSDPSDTLDIGLGKWQVSRAKWDVRVETADFRTKGSIGRLSMESDYFYLNGAKVGIRSLDLADADIAAVLTKTTRKPASTTSATNASTPGESTPGWQAKLGTVRFANNRLRFDDENAPRQPTGLDYGHLDLQNLGINGRFLVYQDLGAAGQRISGQIRNGRFRSSSGFVLQNLGADVSYTDKTTSLTRLIVETPQTVLRDQLVLRYDSLAQLSDPRFASRVSVRLNLQQSQLAVSDILQLAPFLADTPPFAGNRGAIIRANAQATGTLASLYIPRFDLSMLAGTRIRARGRLTNVTDPNRLGLDIEIVEATTRTTDINQLAPKGAIPSSVSLPPQLLLTGRLNGELNNLTLDASLQTPWGQAGFDGRLAGFVTGTNQSYAGTLDLQNFEVGRWTNQTATVGSVTGRATVDGTGIDVNTLTTNFNLNIQSAELNGYRYQNLDAVGRLTNGNLTVEGGLNDPNAKVRLNTQVGLKGEYPSVAGEVAIQELNLQQLKLYDDPLSLQGRLLLNLSSTNPTKPVGTVSAGDAVVTLQGKSYPVDSLYARFTADSLTKGVVATIPGARIRLNGQFEYAQLYDIIAGEISQYIAVPALTYTRIPPPHDLTIGLTAYQNPLLRAFVPALTRLDTVRLTAYLDSNQDTTFSATLRTGVIEYDTTVVNGVNLALRGSGNQLRVNGQINSIQVSGLNLRETDLTGTAANNQLRFAVVNKDSAGRDRHGLAGELSIIDSTNYRLQLARRGLLTNYQQWTIDTSGYLQYGDDGLRISNFRIEDGEQFLELSNTESYGNAPIRVTAHRIELANLARLAEQDTTLASGELNGTVVVRDYIGEDNNLAFIGSIYVDSLQAVGQPIGNLTARFRNTSEGRIDVNTVLAGPYNDATITGYYNPENAREALNLAINLQRLDARTIEAFSFGELRQARGKLTGQFTVAGATDNPQLDGSVAFDSVAFNIKQLNATYRIDQEKLTFSGQTITLNDFNIRDTLGRTLTTDGTVTLKNLPDVAYNLRVRADRFQVLNASRKDNDYAYGNASVSADVRIRGSGTTPAITGTIRLEDGSEVSVVLPDESMDVSESRQIVTFIDHSDSLTLSKYLIRAKQDTISPRLTFEQLSNANISLNLEATDKSELTIVIDELNGDNLRARGNARLNVGINAAGQITVLGRYDVTEGEYSLTYEVLKRQFEIQKGSYIQFTGDPLKADVNITAIYQVSTAPSDLIGSESTTTGTNTQRKLPFNVVLTISDNITTPKLNFDIRLAGNNTSSDASANSPLGTAIENKLKTLRQDESQINKQVFALLILSRFLPENVSDFFSGSGTGGGLGTQAEGLARNSVSKLLSDQLGRFASGILKGFDVDFNLLSQTGAANTGGRTNGARTDLNVGLSRSFLEGRLTVTVGRNFVLENQAGSATRNPNEVFDNVSVNYNLSRDGRYVLRGYRRNDYQAVLDGYVIETGVGFVITVDYDVLSDIFKRSPGATTLNNVN
ncbi:AsmA family protein [Fibrisoma montanum]|uniref:AsmA family protein n=1 Tax=Fibrisoma montanum TaxID=2305895 RepID=A0A418MHW0_9BACT|nr:translocation/assembly module TamB domain-containing protein [Fibrisoma montanum]RIV27010.1 AsmA family protein [Fibrisoma montanum]